MDNPLKITIVISLTWHIFCMIAVQPILGTKFKSLNFVNLSFLGPILSLSDLNSKQTALPGNYQRAQLYFTQIRNLDMGNLSRSQGEWDYFTFLFRVNRPHFFINTTPKKTILTFPLLIDLGKQYRRESTLMFYPRLPYSFLIYFNDRQRAHIEFSFYVSDKGKVAFINRRISSGNLEADLLACRYISRWLSITGTQFPANTWQTAKIDLARKDD